MTTTYYSADQYAGPVASFMQAAGQAVSVPLDRDTPSSVVDLRLRLMDEELSEVFEAINLHDPVLVAHELADLLYVVFGTAVAFGIPIDEVFAAVARANMSKINSATGVPYEVELGKVKKGPDYYDPTADITEIMRTKLVG
jgi:predicted HAD superfamily Cof-like phosphohydrolase